MTVCESTDSSDSSDSSDFFLLLEILIFSIVTKLKKSNGDKTYILKWWQNSKTWIVTKTQNHKLWQNSKNQNLKKLNSNGGKTDEEKKCERKKLTTQSVKKVKNSKHQIVTKLKKISLFFVV